jgi:hypothetical protein
MVYTRVQALPNGPSNGLRHLSLIDWVQSRVYRALNTAMRCHEFGDDGEVLASSWLAAIIITPLSRTIAFILLEYIEPQPWYNLPIR